MNVKGYHKANPAFGTDYRKVPQPHVTHADADDASEQGVIHQDELAVFIILCGIRVARRS